MHGGSPAPGQQAVKHVEGGLPAVAAAQIAVSTTAATSTTTTIRATSWPLRLRLRAPLTCGRAVSLNSVRGILPGKRKCTRVRCRPCTAFLSVGCACRIEGSPVLRQGRRHHLWLGLHRLIVRLVCGLVDD